MIELRYVMRSVVVARGPEGEYGRLERVLQYRTGGQTFCANGQPSPHQMWWSDWKDVPVAEGK